MRGQCAMDWASATGVHLKFKAARQKAWLVERHNEILRKGLRCTESQLIKESVRATFDEQVLATVFFMKNSLTVVNSSNSYQALFGRQPAMLPPLEGGHNGQVDSQARLETNAHNNARVRKIVANKTRSHITGKTRTNWFRHIRAESLPQHFGSRIDKPDRQLNYRSINPTT